MIYTSLKKLRAAGACFEGYNKLVCSISGGKYSANRKTYVRFKHDADIDLLHIVESNGIDDALWALRASNATDRDCRLFAVWCARQVNQNEICKNTLFVAERYANGNATNKELDSAWAAASDSARDAAWAAAWAAARDAARDAQKEMLIKMCNGEAPWQKGE